MILAIASEHIAAPAGRVLALYADPTGWQRVFSLTIRGVRIVRQDAVETVIEVDHVEGTVLNILRQVSPSRIDLTEFKRRYDATFTNEFRPEGGGCRYTLTAGVRLKGPFRLLEPFARPIVVARMRRYVLLPMKAAAEAMSGTPDT